MANPDPIRRRTHHRKYVLIIPFGVMLAAGCTQHSRTDVDTHPVAVIQTQQPTVEPSQSISSTPPRRIRGRDTGATEVAPAIRPPAVNKVEIEPLATQQTDSVDNTEPSVTPPLLFEEIITHQSGPAWERHIVTEANVWSEAASPPIQKPTDLSKSFAEPEVEPTKIPATLPPVPRDEAAADLAFAAADTHPELVAEPEPEPEPEAETATTMTMTVETATVTDPDTGVSTETEAAAMTESETGADAPLEAVQQPADPTAWPHDPLLIAPTTLVVENPARTKHAVYFLIDGRREHLPPGNSLTIRLQPGERPTVRFDRGGTHGTVEYRLDPHAASLYRFVVTRWGWDLRLFP